MAELTLYAQSIGEQSLAVINFRTEILCELIIDETS